jgi:hypothetical protein
MNSAKSINARHPGARKLAAAVLAITSFLYFSLATAVSFYVFNLLTAAFICVCIWAAIRQPSHREDVTSFIMYTSFLLSVLVFHFSLIPVYLLNQFDIYFLANRWYFDAGPVRFAYIASSLFVMGYVFSGFLPDISRHVWPYLRERVPPKLTDGWQYIVAVSVLGLTWIIVFIVVLGIRSYLEFYSLPGWATALEIYIYPAIWGALLWGCCLTRRWRHVAVAFAPWGMIAFLAGMRGPVLFPVVMTVAALRTQSRIKLNVLHLAVGSLVFLYLASFVFVYRISNNFDEALLAASPFRGLAELGGSLRPVYDTVTWLASGTDHLRFGATYWAPFERTYSLVIPGLERLPAAMDDRLTPGLMDQRSGAYGYSIVAEALLNFGYVGCAFIGGVAGLFFRLLGAHLRAGRLPVWACSVAAGFFFHIRQGFVGAFGFSCTIFAMYLLMKIIGPFFVFGKRPNRGLVGETFS